MPAVTRPGGVEIHWEEHGSGPTVVMAHQCISYPEVYEAVRDELAADHRVITYHQRGCGLSSRVGPYEDDTDDEDLIAVIEAAGGLPAIGLGMGDGALREARIAAARPDLLSHVVVAVGHTLGGEATRDTDALTSSPSVLQALLHQLGSDYRGAIHSMVAVPNPQLDAEQVHARIDRTVEHVPQDVAVIRMRLWMRGDATDASQKLGDRLWILQMPENPWFTPEIGERMRVLLPEAHIVDVPDGPMSRPDVAAGIVRSLTGSGQAGALSSDSQR